MTINALDTQATMLQVKYERAKKSDFLVEKIKKYENYSRIANYVGWTAVIVMAASAIGAIVVFSLPAWPVVFGAIILAASIFAPIYVSQSRSLGQIFTGSVEMTKNLGKVIYPSVALNTAVIAGGIICGVGIVAAAAFLVKNYFDEKILTLNEELMRLNPEINEYSDSIT